MSNIKNHPNCPSNQPFKGAPKTKKSHWSNIRGNNNVTKKDGKKND